MHTLLRQGLLLFFLASPLSYASSISYTETGIDGLNDTFKMHYIWDVSTDSIVSVQDFSFKSAANSSNFDYPNPMYGQWSSGFRVNNVAIDGYSFNPGPPIDSVLLFFYRAYDSRTGLHSGAYGASIILTNNDRISWDASQVTIQSTALPEPTTMVLLTTSLIAYLAYRKKRFLFSFVQTGCTPT